jgi:hypothetical protein
MLVIGILSLLGFGTMIKGIFSLLTEFREWKGVVDQDRKANATDHGQFRGDIRDAHIRIDGIMG